MKNINKLQPQTAINFEDENGNKITLIKDETIIQVITDGSEHEREYRGLVTFVSEDGLEIENESGVIFWEYIKEINVVKSYEDFADLATLR